eukprot:3270045-Amphidinium_carterae.1
MLWGFSFRNVAGNPLTELTLAQCHCSSSPGTLAVAVGCGSSCSCRRRCRHRCVCVGEAEQVLQPSVAHNHSGPALRHSQGECWLSHSLLRLLWHGGV